MSPNVPHKFYKVLHLITAKRYIASSGHIHCVIVSRSYDLFQVFKGFGQNLLASFECSTNKT